ncbi:MAG TPA: GAF domain-containing protein [Polyangiaceae bacterium]
MTEVVSAIDGARGDFGAMLSSFARACVPDLGEMCIVDLVHDDGTVDRVDAVHVDPSHAETMRAMRGPFTPRSEHPLTKVIASGRPMLERIVDDRGLTRISRSPAHLVLLRRFGPRSSIRLPVMVDGRTVAVLTFCITEPSRRYSPSDMALAQQLVARVAAAAAAG